MENQDHLLIHCSFTRCHWFLKEMGLVWKLPRSTHELFDADLGCDIGMRGGWNFLRVIFHCICWSIWLERNRWIFHSLEESIEECWYKIKIRASS